MSRVMTVPDGWVIDIIENLAKIVTGDKDTQDKLEDGKYPFYVRSNTVERINSYSFDGEAVLTAGDGVGVGKVFHHVNEKFDFHQRVYCIYNFSKRLDPKFFFEYFQENFIKRVNKYSAKGSVDSVRYDMISLMEIPVPPLKEQQRIGKVLSTLDQSIEATQKLIAKEKNIKKGLMHDLLSNGIDKNGKIRTPQTHKYKESELGLIPEGWEVFELKDNLTYISYGFTNPMPTTERGPFMVTAADIKYGKISYLTCRKTSQEAFYNLLTQKSKPIKNDILLTKDGTLGRIALMDDSIVCINQSVALLRPNNQVNAMFLKHLLESSRYQKKILDDAGGSTIKHIYITIIDKMKLAQPLEVLEQTQISNILTTQDKKIETEEKNLAKLQELKKGLMHDLLSGKVRVKV